MLKYMKSFTPGYIPKVLMLGNGIHRAFESESWDALLRSINGGRFTETDWKELSHVPYPLLAVIASDDSLGSRMREKGIDLCNQVPPEKQRQLLSGIAELHLDAVLTTNYTYEVEKSMIDGFVCQPHRRCGFRHQTCKDKPKAETEALYTYISVQDDLLPPIWHIHGEAAKPDTMIIGHYYYGKLLGRVQAYVKETVRRYNTAERNKTEFYPRSWVDYFLYGDVTIVGLGMNMCEMDLWWLFNCKKRNGRGSIHYIEPNISREKELLARAYGVQVITKNISSDEYLEHYCQTIDALK